MPPRVGVSIVNAPIAYENTLQSIPKPTKHLLKAQLTQVRRQTRRQRRCLKTLLAGFQVLNRYDDETALSTAEKNNLAVLSNHNFAWNLALGAMIRVR